MQAQKLLLGAMCTAFFGMVACTGLEPYKIDAPEDLADKIAQYKAEKEAEQAVPDDAVEIELSPEVVGAEDNSSGWWTEFSQYFTIPVAKKLVLSFVNYGTGVNNWNNWNLAITTPFARGTDGYVEYSVIRSDQYGWGSVYDGANIALDIDGEGPGDDSWWAAFREKMNGATFEIVIDHASEGTAYVVATGTALDGSIITETFHCPVSFVDDINAFLICDGSHFKMERAYLTSSDYPILPDSNPAGIKVTGFPEHVDVGATFEDILENSTLTANVVYEDGSAAAVPVENVNFSVEETFGTIPGEELILYTYDLSKKGVKASAVAGYAKVTVLAPMTGIKAGAKINVVGSSKFVTLSPTAVSVVGQYAGGGEVPMSAADCTIEFTDNKIVYSAVPGTYTNAFTVTYGEGDAAFTTTGDLVIAASTQAPQTETVGATDNTTGFHAASSKRWTVAAGESETVNFTVGGTAANFNWNCPLVFLYSPAGEEYAFVRLDNWGTGTGYTAATIPTSNWNWETFLSGMVGANVSLTIANDGLGSASVRMEVLYANSELHFQYFDVITVQPGELQFEVSVELCHLLFGEVAPGEDPDPIPAATLTGISASVTANMIGGARYLTLSPSAVKVIAHYSDETSVQLNNADVQISFTDDKLVYQVDPGDTVTGVATVKYTPAGGSEVSTSADLIVNATTLPVQNTQVGAADYSNGWWQTFSDQWNVPAGECVSASMTLRSAAALNHQCVCTILRQTDNTEFAVVRMDNYGWLYATNTFEGLDQLGWTLSSNWNWDNFLTGLDNSKVVVTVANDGNGKGSIRYYVVYQNDETHFQYYDNINVNSEDLNMAFVNEASLIIFD